MIPKAKDYSGSSSNGGGGMGKARDFTSVNGDSAGSGGRTKAKEFYGGTGIMAKSMSAKQGDTAPRSIPTIKVTNPLPAGGTRQITLPRGPQMHRR